MQRPDDPRASSPRQRSSDVERRTAIRQLNEPLRDREGADHGVRAGDHGDRTGSEGLEASARSGGHQIERERLVWHRRARKEVAAPREPHSARDPDARRARHSHGRSREEPQSRDSRSRDRGAILPDGRPAHGAIDLKRRGRLRLVLYGLLLDRQRRGQSRSPDDVRARIPLDRSGRRHRRRHGEICRQGAVHALANAHCHARRRSTIELVVAELRHDRSTQVRLRRALSLSRGGDLEVWRLGVGSAWDRERRRQEPGPAAMSNLRRRAHEWCI